MVKFTAFIIVQLNGVENNAQSSCAIIISKAFVVFAVETSIAHSVAHKSVKNPPSLTGNHPRRYGGVDKNRLRTERQAAVRHYNLLIARQS